jgi:hypothetical protein
MEYHPSSGTIKLVANSGIDAYMHSLNPNDPAPTCPGVGTIPFPPTPRIAGNNLKVENLTEFTINPNPVKGSSVILQSELRPIEVHLVTLAGKEVMLRLKTKNTSRYEVYIPEFVNQGIYYVKIFFEDQSIGTEKLIIE